MSPQEFAQIIKQKYPQYQGVDDTTLTQQILEKYPSYAASVDFGVLPEAITEVPSFGERVGENIQERRGQFRQGLERQSRGEQSALSTGVQLLGKGAGLAFDIAGSGIATAYNKLPEGVRENIRQVGMDILESPIGQSGLKALQAGMETYGKFKNENPVVAENIESLVNVGFLFPGVSVGGRGAEAIAKTAGRGASALERSALESVESFAQKLVRPIRNKAVRTSEVARTTETGRGLFKRSIIAPTRLEQMSAEEIAKIPGVSASKTYQQNYNIISAANDAEAIALKKALENTKIIVPKRELRAELSRAKTRLSLDPEVVGDSAKTAERLVDKFDQFLAEEPGTPAGILEARKRYDTYVKSRKGERILDPKTENAFSVANREIRQTVNGFLDSAVPDVGVRESLRRQFSMYDALKTIEAKAAEEADTAIGRFFQGAKNVIGTRNEAFNTAAAALGLGGIAAGSIAFAGPAAAIGVPALLIYKGGKLILRPETKRALATMLRELERVAQRSTSRVEVQAIEDLKSSINEFIENPRAGLSIEDVSKKAAGVAATPKTAEGLTTKFLEYAKGKQTLSRQEIADFARRPELKKGEADLLLKKLEEFTSADLQAPKLLQQRESAIAKGQIESDVPFGSIIPVFRGGGKIDISKVDPVKGISVSVDRKIGEYWKRGTKGGVLEELYIIPEAKIYFPTKQELNKGEFSVVAKAGEQGFDAVNLTKNGEGEIRILNPKVLQTSPKLPAQDFADSIRRDLLELKPVKVKEPQYGGITINQQTAGQAARQGDRNFDIRNLQGKNYEEVVFESPITTNGSSHYPNSKNYFAHARGDEVVEGGNKIWREQEIQSDALQKDAIDYSVERYIWPTPSKDFNRYIELKQKINEGKILSMRESDEYQALSKYKESKQIELEAEKQKKIAPLLPFTNDRFGERIMRERIREKAQKGYDSYRLPTGETIGKIEGFTETNWFIEPQRTTQQVLNTPINQLYRENAANVLKPEQLKVGLEVRQFNNMVNDSWIITDILGDGRFKAVPKSGFDEFVKQEGSVKEALKNIDDLAKETHDLTGKSNPQYRRYENWGKFLKNKFGAKQVTDPQGNTWFEIDITPEMKKMPIEAFGIGALATQKEE